MNGSCRWVGVLTGLLIWLATLGLCPGESSAADAVLGPEAAKSIPIVDGHFHLMSWMDIKELVGVMDRNGIQRAGGVGEVGAPRANAEREEEARQALGARYIQATGQGQWLSLMRQGGVAALQDASHPIFKGIFGKIEADLRDHDARVIGEIFVNTETTLGSPFGHNKIKANAATLKALLDLAGKYDRPLNVHANWDRDTAVEFQELAAYNRNARLILAHCGGASAKEMRDLLQRNANVVCDLSHRSPPQLKGKGAERAVFDSQLRGDWKTLIEDFPGRFIVGLDGQENWQEYEATVHNIRFGLLANLKPAVAEMVAYKNADIWFGR